jgi:hypothetical protein
LPRGFSVFNNALTQRVPALLRCLNLNPLLSEEREDLFWIYLRAIFLNICMKKIPFIKVTTSSQNQQNYE